jgi:hypothetical protein
VHGSVPQESAPDPTAGVIRVYRHLLDVKAAVHGVRDEIAHWLVVWANCYPGKPGSPAAVEDADRERCVRGDLRHPDICEAQTRGALDLPQHQQQLLPNRPDARGREQGLRLVHTGILQHGDAVTCPSLRKGRLARGGSPGTGRNVRNC